MTDDKADLNYLNYQVKHGVSLRDALSNLGYVKHVWHRSDEIPRNPHDYASSEYVISEKNELCFYDFEMGGWWEDLGHKVVKSHLEMWAYVRGE